MNNVIGTKTLPCRHHRIRPPDAIGSFPRHCDVCRSDYTLIVELSPEMTVRCGCVVLRARWLDHTSTSTDQVESGLQPAKEREPGRCVNSPGPLGPITEARS